MTQTKRKRYSPSPYKLQLGSFLHKFTETSIFSYFIDTCLRHVDNPHIAFFNFCLKTKRTKKSPILLSNEKLKKTINCVSPNLTGIPNGSVFFYDVFPRLDKSLFHSSELPEQFIEDQPKKFLVENEEAQLFSIEDMKWGKYLLECIYTVWFVLFSMKLKRELPHHYTSLVEYSFLMLDELRKRVIAFMV